MVGVKDEVRSSFTLVVAYRNQSQASPTFLILARFYSFTTLAFFYLSKLLFRGFLSNIVRRMLKIKAKLFCKFVVRNPALNLSSPA